MSATASSSGGSAAASAVQPLSGRAYAALAGLQILALLGMIAWKGSIFVTAGPTVVLETLPVDPRSLFMGDYVRLRYAIGESHGGAPPLAPGEPVWVVLEESEGVWRAVACETHEPPAQDPARPFVRGTVEACFAPGDCLFLFGIEEYYVREDRGLALEEAARAGRVLVTVKLDARGRAAIAAVTPEQPAGPPLVPEALPIEAPAP